jgi:hypothetical protein
MMRRLMVTLSVAAATVLTVSACTPDTTRERVEGDISVSFGQAYALSEQLQGNPVVHPDVTSTECHTSANKTPDTGPGAWSCDLAYTAGGKQEKVSLLVLVDSLGCYQGLDGEHRDATIKVKDTGATIPDPKVGFDGCYNVYDDRTG